MTSEKKNETYPQHFICPSYQFNYHANWKIAKRIGKKDSTYCSIFSKLTKKGPEFEGKSIACYL